jgi:hypothetical protein
MQFGAKKVHKDSYNVVVKYAYMLDAKHSSHQISKTS